MKNLKTLERLQQLHNLISNENTGTPKNLAKLMNISERRIHHLIEDLKEMNAPINYSRKTRTYRYEESFDLKVTISVTVLNNNEVTQIFGGSYFVKPKQIDLSNTVF
jgi:hypothetical protein